MCASPSFTSTSSPPASFSASRCCDDICGFGENVSGLSNVVCFSFISLAETTNMSPAVSFSSLWGLNPSAASVMDESSVSVGMGAVMRSGDPSCLSSTAASDLLAKSEMRLDFTGSVTSDPDSDLCGSTAPAAESVLVPVAFGFMGWTSELKTISAEASLLLGLFCRRSFTGRRCGSAPPPWSICSLLPAGCWIALLHKSGASGWVFTAYLVSKYSRACDCLKAAPIGSCLGCSNVLPWPGVTPRSGTAASAAPATSWEDLHQKKSILPCAYGLCDPPFSP